MICIFSKVLKQFTILHFFFVFFFFCSSYSKEKLSVITQSCNEGSFCQRSAGIDDKIQKYSKTEGEIVTNILSYDHAKCYEIKTKDSETHTNATAQNSSQKDNRKIGRKRNLEEDILTDLLTHKSKPCLIQTSPAKENNKNHVNAYRRTSTYIKKEKSVKMSNLSGENSNQNAR